MLLPEVESPRIGVNNKSNLTKLNSFFEGVLTFCLLKTQTKYDPHKAPFFSNTFCHKSERSFWRCENECLSKSNLWKILPGNGLGCWGSSGTSFPFHFFFHPHPQQTQSTAQWSLFCGTLWKVLEFLKQVSFLLTIPWFNFSLHHSHSSKVLAQDTTPSDRNPHPHYFYHSWSKQLSCACHYFILMNFLSLDKFLVISERKLNFWCKYQKGSLSAPKCSLKRSSFFTSELSAVLKDKEHVWRVKLNLRAGQVN